MIAKLNVTVGQELVVLPSTSYEDRPNFGYVVTRVSPSGKFEVRHPTQTGSAFTYFFNTDGRELAGGMNGRAIYDGARCETDVAAWRARAARRKALVNAATAINDVKLTQQVRAQWGKEAMQSQIDMLQSLLDAAKAAVAAL